MFRPELMSQELNLISLGRCKALLWARLEEWLVYKTSNSCLILRL